MTEHVETPQKSRFNLRSGRDVAPEDNYSTVITGHINIPEDGIYYFSTSCDQLLIDCELFISNEGMVKRFPLTDRPIALAKGTHNIKMVRLSGVVGGWHPQWQAMYISVREDNEPGFRTLEAEDYI